jgi:hypothetical protein
LLAQLMPVLQGIGAAQKNLADTSASSGGVAGDTAAALTNLQAALEGFDIHAKEIADELLPLAQGTAAYSTIESLIACIDSFDFGGALDILRENESAIIELKKTDD